MSRPYDPDAHYPYPSPWAVPAAGSWRDEAACSGMPLEIFFLPVGQSGEQAKAVCGRCPVRIQCLEDALRYTTTSDTSGIRGGLRAKERGAIRAARRRHEQEASA